MSTIDYILTAYGLQAQKYTSRSSPKPAPYLTAYRSLNITSFQSNLPDILDSMAQKITLYGHAACAQVGPVKGVLSKAGVDYDYVNIRTDPDAAALVRDINDGFESVPTLVFPDGTTLTEPSYGQLANKLKALGYTLSPYAWLTGNFWLIVLAIGILFAALRMFGVF